MSRDFAGQQKCSVKMFTNQKVLDGGHSGDAREVDERRSGPHQREREGATQGELVSVTRKEGNIDNTSRD